MAEKWLGVVVSGSQVNVAHLEIDNDSATVENQFTWKLQSGDSVSAYTEMAERFSDYIKNNAIDNVVIKSSAVGQARPTLAHLKSAELRGAISVASSGAGASTQLVQKAVISRTFGERKADEYVRDDSFWEDSVTGELTKSRREAALLVLSQKDKK